MSILKLLHPDYIHNTDNWTKWRLTYEGGSEFVETYLKKFSTREDATDFETRKAISYCPRFAGAAIDEIKNSIYQRIVDVTREGGPDSYKKAIHGLEGGVDLQGRSMYNFMGTQVLPELLQMGKVGIFVDKHQKMGNTIFDNLGNKPYMYVYPIENIRAWIPNPQKPNEFQAVILENNTYSYDEETKFATNTTVQYHHLWLSEYGVRYDTWDDKGEELIDSGIIEISRIPFVCVELSNSLLADIADYQVALLNLASSDLNYALKSNFPFYVEQFDANIDFLLRNETTDGEASEAKVAADQEIRTGVSHGRRYPLGAERPGFIHPSSEPLKASIAKQEQLKAEIRLLLNLTIANLKPQRESAESKREDSTSLDAGLSYIGLALELAEKQIAEIWGLYEGSTPATINYPETYSLKSDAERREEGKDLADLKDRITSTTFKKAVDREVARIVIGTKVAKEELLKIEQEIEAGVGVTATASDVASDVENGLVSAEYASRVRGYPPGEAEKAKKEHAERLARIQEAQMQGGAARGVADTDPEPGKSGSQEKAESRDNTNRELGDATRGEGK